MNTLKHLKKHIILKPNIKLNDIIAMLMPCVFNRLCLKPGPAHDPPGPPARLKPGPTAQNLTLELTLGPA